MAKDMTNEEMRQVANSIKKQLPEGQGFVLLTFEFGEGLREFRYISNGQRADMINTLEALLAKWKQQSDSDN